MTAIYILFGSAVGFIFGYILTRTGITKYPRVMGMLLLRDFKILKFMLTAVTASMILFYLFSDLGLLKVVPKNLDWGKLVGGLVFGAGMGILGYCPGTMAARIGEGKKEAIFAAFGMSLGIFIYALTIRPVRAALLSSEMNGDIFALLGLHRWLVIAIAAVVFVSIIVLVDRKFDDNRENF
jgi:uncharacterized membrane protein YedE/YeeE